MATNLIGWDTDVLDTDALISPNLTRKGSRNTAGGIDLNFTRMFEAADLSGMPSISSRNGLGPSTTMQNIGLGINAFAGLAGAYSGFQQLQLGKRQLQQNKDIFNLNFANQARGINTELEDRQRARVASNPDAYESVDSYLKKNALSTRGI